MLSSLRVLRSDVETHASARLFRPSQDAGAKGRRRVRGYEATDRNLVHSLDATVGSAHYSLDAVKEHLDRFDPHWQRIRA